MVSLIAALFLLAQTSQDLQERIESLEGRVQELEEKQAQTVSANPSTLLNPAITVFGNFLWRLDNQDVYSEDGGEIDDTANLREAELDLRAAIDPFADGLLILSLESEVPGTYDVGIEECFATLRSLPVPFWEEPPLGTTIKVGRFRTEFGRNNRLHLHDLPQSNRPLVVEEFLGHEGHLSSGVSTRCLLPSPGDSALELTIQAIQGGNISVARDPGHPAFLANLRLFLPLADDHSVDASLIGLYGTNDPHGHRQSRVASVDFLYRWKPLRQGEHQSFLLGGQLFLADHEFKEDTDLDGRLTSADASFRSDPAGFVVWSQYQLSARLYAGLRWDQTDFVEDDTRSRRRIQPYFSWYTSEYLRFRASYEHTWSDDAAEDGRDTFLLEMNVVFGAHPPEPFWVNR